MAKKGQKFNKYPQELKLEIVNKYLNNQGTSRSLAKEYGMSYHTIENMIYTYKRQGHLNDGNADNPNPATGKISVMYTSSKLYLFAEITDSTKLTNVSAWDPFNVLEYDSYKYNTDYLNRLFKANFSQTIKQYIN